MLSNVRGKREQDVVKKSSGARGFGGRTPIQ